jgi:hypothetical protein
MPITANGVTITNIIANGVTMSTVVANGVTVFSAVATTATPGIQNLSANPNAFGCGAAVN